MAFGTYLRRSQPEGGCRRILDIVYAVAVNAGGNVGVILIVECCTMHAVDIFLVDFIVTVSAGLRRAQACFLKQLTGLRVCPLLDVVRAMAVCTHRRFSLTGSQRLSVNAVL